MRQKHIEITEYENAALRQMMDKCGYLKESHLIRDLIMNTVPIQYPKETFEAILKELHKIGVNINQIAHMANATGIVDSNELREQEKLLSDCVVEIKRAVYEPHKRREIEEVVKDIQFWIFDELIDEDRMIDLREELLDLLRKAENRK